MAAMTSRERILAVLDLKQPDRVPVSLHCVGWFGNPPDPSFERLFAFARENLDHFKSWGPNCLNSNAFCTAHPSAKVHTESKREGDRVEYRGTINTPRGPLHHTSYTIDHIWTSWTIEHWLKTDEDIERFLSIPYVPPDYDLTGFPEADRELGDRGVMFPGFGDPVCIVADLFDFGDWTVRAMTDRKNIRRLLDAMAPRVMDYVTASVESGAGPLYRLVGPEYASPPYVHNELFREYVVEYDKPLVDLIHSYGQKVRCHCHGRSGTLLEMIVDELGCDAIDPLEAPPDGDCTLAEAKERVGDRCCLFGNMQYRHLETCEPEEIDDLVRRSIDEAGEGGGFVLMPTAEPVADPLDPRTERNYIQYIESAHKWGQY